MYRAVFRGRRLVPHLRTHTSQPWPPPAKRSPNPTPHTTRDGYRHFDRGHFARQSPSSPYMRYIVTASGLALSYYLYSHTERAPFTGRLRLLSISRQTEHILGRDAFHDIVSHFPGQILPPNHRHSRRVRRVVSRIARTVHSMQPQLIEGFEWAIVVALNDEPNALCVPGGRILITTGLLNILPTDDDLAVVLGHEIAHAVNRHGSENIDLQRTLMPIMILLNHFLEMRWLTSMLLSLTLTLPYSRTLEYEADEVGLLFCAHACYDPRVAPGVFSRLAKATDERSGTFIADKVAPFLSTHPQSRERSARLQKAIPEKMKLYNDKCVFASSFPRTKL